MEFIPLYFADRLHIVNRQGYVGVVTLWSRISFVLRRLAEAGVDLEPTTSPVAVVGNLYGNGLKHLLRNLLYNPQIRYLVICGRNLSGSQEDLINFFRYGVEESELLGVKCRRVIGTGRIVDNLLTPELFARPPQLIEVGDLRDTISLKRLREVFARITPPPAENWQRIELPLPDEEVSFYPSNPRAHTITARRPLEAWLELIFRLVRFGQPVVLKKGRRQELQNVKVIVEEPLPEPAEELAKYGFSLAHFLTYGEDLLCGKEPGDDTAYRYGHRLRSYFRIDGLQEVITRLQEDREDRHCYISLWDTARDLKASSGRPCLVSLFFRFFAGKLTLSAVFRTHNALDAWLENCYGLMAVQQYVAAACSLPPGALTIISHSISVDLNEYERALAIARAKKYTWQPDPHGAFRVTVEDGEIVVRHLWEGMVINEYRHRRAAPLAHALARDCALSDIGHALYLGRQLARAEMCLEYGWDFEEE